MESQAKTNWRRLPGRLYVNWNLRLECYRGIDGSWYVRPTNSRTVTYGPYGSLRAAKLAAYEIVA